MRTVFPRVPAWTAVLLASALAPGCGDGDSRALGGSSMIEVDAGGGGDFASLQRAVDAAAAGSTIRVRGGALSEQVVVAKSLTIVGTGGARLDLPGTPMAFPDDSSDMSSAVLVIRDTSGVVVRGMTFRGPQDGIQVRNASDVTIEGVDASGNGDDGIDVRNASRVTISGTFTGNGDQGVIVREGSRNVTVSACTSSANRDHGIRVRDASAVQVTTCDVASNGDDGIEVRDASGVELVSNRITGNAGYGIRIRNAADTVEQSNTLSGNVEGTVRRE